MTTIPGAEFAPIIAIIGGRYQQPSEGAEQQFRSAEAVLHGTTLKTMGGHVRRLSCSDPDDIRAIWRQAALALGATEEEALHADFHRRELTLIGASDPCKEWRLDVREWCAIRTLATLHLPGCDDAYATAALCAHVWGPR